MFLCVPNMSQFQGNKMAKSRNRSRWYRIVFCPEVGVSVHISEKGPGITLVWQVWSSEKGPGITLVWQVWSSEKGPFLSPNSDRFGVRRKNRAKPWFGRFGVRPVLFNELRTLAGLEFGERTGLNLCSAGLEKGPGRALVW